MARSVVPTTVAALQALAAERTQREIASRCGTSQGVISHALNGGPVSLRTENRIREALALDPIKPPTATVPTCPDCGQVHNGGRCHGRPVEVVLRRRRPDPPPWVQEATANLRTLARRAGHDI